jgi:hypothetical protein
MTRQANQELNIKFEPERPGNTVRFFQSFWFSCAEPISTEIYCTPFCKYFGISPSFTGAVLQYNINQRLHVHMKMKSPASLVLAQSASSRKHRLSCHFTESSTLEPITSFKFFHPGTALKHVFMR